MYSLTHIDVILTKRDVPKQGGGQEADAARPGEDETWTMEEAWEVCVCVCV